MIEIEGMILQLKRLAENENSIRRQLQLEKAIDALQEYLKFRATAEAISQSKK